MSSPKDADTEDPLVKTLRAMEEGEQTSDLSSSKPVPSSSKPGSSNSEPSPSSSKPGPSSSKPGPSSSKPGPSSSKPGPSSSKPGPSSSKPGPSSSKPGPSSSKPDSTPDLERVVLDVSDGEAEEQDSRGDDEFGLVEEALTKALRPVMRRCDDVLSDADEVQVSAITSEQRRALGRVDGEGSRPRAEIVTDFVKLEVEEHELQEEPMQDDPAWTISETRGGVKTPSAAAATAAADTGYGRPYTTTSQDRRSRGRGIKLAVTPANFTPRGRGAPTPRGRGAPTPVGRGAPAPVGRGKPPVTPPAPSRGRGRGRGRGARGRGRARGRGIQVQSSPGVVHLQSGGRPAAKHSGPIEVLRLPERELRVAVVRDRLVLQRIDEDSTDPVPSYHALTFMELVNIKETLTKMVDKCNKDGPEEHVPRLRAARRISISWVETRLRAEAQGDMTPRRQSTASRVFEPPVFESRAITAGRRMSTAATFSETSRTGSRVVLQKSTPHGKQGRSKYDALPVGPPAPASQRSAAASGSPSKSRPILPKPQQPGGVTVGLKAPVVGVKLAPAGARQATLPGQTPARDDPDDPDYDPTVEESTNPKKARKQLAARAPPAPPPSQPPQPAALPTSPFGSARLININTQVKNPKSSRDIVILQAKLRDLQNVGGELRRAVDYFGVEANKDKAKIARLKNEGLVLEKKLKELEASILGNSPSVLISLLDKDKRKALGPQDDAVTECGELMGEVGNANYSFVIGQGLPLLSAKELEEKTRGASMSWRLDQAELLAAATPAPTGRGRGKKRKRATVDPGAAVDAAVEAVVAGAGSPSVGRGGGGGGGGATPGQTTVGTVDGSEHISLPQEVLEQVMNGKGYLVDENGERLEIRVLGDQVQTQ